MIRFRRIVSLVLAFLLFMVSLPAGVITVSASSTDNNKFDLIGSSMTLGNALDMNFFVQKSSITGSDNYALITKHYADGREDVVARVEQDNWMEYNDMWYFTFQGIRAKEMADPVDVVICNAQGEAISNVFTDSVQGYCRRIMDKETTAAKDKVVFVEMLNYGAAAQKYFGYDSSNPANSVLSSEEQTLFGVSERAYEILLEADSIYCGTSLTLENQIVFNFFYHRVMIPANGYAVASFTNHQGVPQEERVDSVNFADYTDTIQYVPFTSLVVADCSQPVTVKLYDAEGNVVSTVTDSIESYVARQDEPLFTAIMRFSDAAYIYFHGCLHSWSKWTTVTEPTYTSEGAKTHTCTECGKTETQVIPMKDVNDHTHAWIIGSCTDPIACAVCGITDNVPGHTWKDATCTTPKTCAVCSITEGDALDHDWKAATCIAPKTCSRCKITEGSTLAHTWKDATCTAPKTCSVCKKTQGKALEHTLKAATCQTPKYCTRCGKADTIKSGHTYQDNKCTVCGITYDPNVVDLTDKLNALMRKNAVFLEDYQDKYGYFLAAIYYYLKVTDGGDWDIKLTDEWKFEKGKTYVYQGVVLRMDDPGNIHFGYVGAVLFDEEFVCFGAGMNNVSKFGFSTGSVESYYDDPQDQEMMRWGYHMYEDEIE